MSDSKIQKGKSSKTVDVDTTLHNGYKKIAENKWQKLNEDSDLPYDNHKHTYETTKEAIDKGVYDKSSHKNMMIHNMNWHEKMMRSSDAKYYSDKDVLVEYRKKF